MKTKKTKSKRGAGFKLSPLVIGLLGIYPQATVFASGIVVDPSQNNGLNVTVTANDTPLIQIANPNANGVSHNKFTEFNVSNPGVVFNNSMQDGVSQIGGLAMKNPNLTQAATGIITEVTGANASRLEGTLEVFGQQADLIIANENGIIVNGVSTINTGNLTLSTGQVIQQADGNYMLSVAQGNVTVESGGISTTDLDYFDIVSRSATLNGKISGEAEVQVLTGLNDYDTRSRSHSVRATSADNTPEVAISGSSMGSMYGSRIQLISTESGAGVRHEGSIISTSDIVISASGDISLAGLQAGQDITVSGENINQLNEADSSGFSAQRDLFIHALEQLTLRSGLVSERGEIRINAGSLLQQAAVIQTNGGSADINTITINVIGDYQLSGSLSALDNNGNVISNAVITLRDGSYVVTVNGKEVAYSTVISDVAVNTKQGNISIQSGSLSNQQGSIVADAGTIVFNVSDVITSSGIIKAKGDITLVSDSLVNSGIAYSSGKLSIDVSDLTNSGALSADNAVSLAASNTLNNSGLVSSNTSLTVSAETIANSGNLVSQDALSVTTTSLTNEGKVHAAGNMALNVDSTLTNSGSGEIVSEKDLTIKGRNLVLDNTGNATIQANNLALTGVQSLNNSDSAQLLITEQLSMDRLTTLNNSGLIQAASLALNNIESLNNDGQLIATSTLLLLANSLKNQGVLQSDGLLSITASDISNTGGTLQAGGEMQIYAGQLQNVQGGNLFSAEDLILTLTQVLNNNASAIASGGTLTIRGVGNTRTLTITNGDGAEISATNVVITAAASLINTDSVIGAADDLNISGLNSLVNKGDDAFIQALDIVISDVSQVTNTGMLYADNLINIENATSLDNAGLIYAHGDLTISRVNDVDNSGELVSDSTLQISDATTFINSGTVSASQLTLKDIASVDNSNTLYADSLIDIKRIENLKNSGLVYSGKNLTIEDVVSFINTSASEAGTEALVVAEAEMVIQRIDELINSGDTAVINAYGRLQLLDIAQLANSDRAVINGDLALILDRVGVLTNLSGASIYSQNGSISISADTITNSGYYIQNIYNDSGALINQIYSSSTIYAYNDLAMETQRLDNMDSALLATGAGDISVVSGLLNNTLGSSISSVGDITLTVSNHIDNVGSEIYARGNLSIAADSLDNSGDGRITATSNATLSLNSLVHEDGRIFATKNLQIDINDDFAFSQGSLNANDNLIINSTGNITNGIRLENYGSIILNATGGVVNQEDSSMVSAADIYITAASFTNEENTLLWSLGDLSIDVRNGAFVNKQNGNIYSNKAMSLIAKTLLNHAGYIKSGTDMEIDAQELTNKSIYDNNGWSLADKTYLYNLYEYKTSGMFTNKDAASLYLPSWVADITLVGKAEIRSGGSLKINQRDITFNGSVGIRPTTDVATVTNTGGAISSVGDMYISGDVVNEPEYVTMTLLEYMTAVIGQVGSGLTLSHSWWGLVDTVHQFAYFETLYDLLDYVYGNATANLDHNDTFYYVLLGIEKSNNPFEQVMTRLFGETWRNLSYANMQIRWSELIANNGSKISDEVVYFLPSDQGSITTGGSLYHTGGSFSNGITNGGVVQQNTVVDVEVGDKTVQSTEVGAQVVVNQKILAEVNMGISTSPAAAQLINIPGMFGHSEAFKKLVTGLVAAEDIGSVGAIVVVIGDATLTVVPMYETRLTMIDKSNFYGSDYFFQQIGYVSETPVTVIGDSYFINELINRQISTSLGSFFAVRDGLDGEALVKELMDNAAKVSDDLGLVVGEPLTAEQRNNLTEDIVWFITTSVDGYDVLTPIVYLSAESQKQLSEGTASAIVHANESVNIDATTINSSNGLISASENVNLVAEGDIVIASSGQDSGVSAGGNILMDSSEGDISVSGSYIESGGDININAESGDVTFIASMDRDEAGNQLINSNNDGITAGGNLNISGNNVDFYAVDVEVGGDASITATDGDVSFNALSQITSDREVTFENNGFMSDKRTDSQSISAEAVTSNITVGGNLSINASEDINIEGSEMTASSGDLTAGNDINITTAQDVSWEKTTVETNELVFGAGASAAGFSAETASSTVDGTTNETSTGYESDSTQGGTNTSHGKTNGAANIPSSAGFQAGYQSTTETTETQSTTNHNASINFGTSGSFTAEGTVDIGGGDFTMDEMSIDATNVASTKYVDETITTTTTVQEFVGIKAEGHSTVTDVIDKYGAMIKETLIDEESKEVNGGEVAASVVGDLTNLYYNDLVGGSYTMGYERQESTTTTVTGQENTTNINVGNLTIKSKEDTELNGVEINADSVNIDVGGNLDINSAKSWEITESSLVTNSAGLTHGAGAGATGAGIGASYDYVHYEEESASVAVNHNNSQINANNITVSVGGDMTMAGANITAGDADIDVEGELNIISQQDTYNSTTSSWQASGSIGGSISTSGVIPTFSAGGGGGSEYRNEALVNEQSGITTSGSMSINTGNDLNLVGGHIVSEDGTGSVTVGGDINAITLEDYIEQDGLYGGGSGGIDYKGNIVVSGYVKTIDEVHYKENQYATIDVGTITVGGEINGDLNTDSSNMSEVTEDRVVAGNDISFTVGTDVKSKKKNKTDSGTNNNTTPDSSTPGTTPGSGSNTTPGSNSGSDTNTTPGTNSGTDSNTTPGTNSGTDSNTTPGTNTAADNGSTTPGTNSGSGNNTNTGTDTVDAGSSTTGSDTPNSGNSSSTDKPSGDSGTTDNTQKPAESPTNVPDTGNTSGSDSPKGDSATTDNSQKPAESPTNVPDTGNSSGSDSPKGDSTITDNTQTPTDGPSKAPDTNTGNTTGSAKQQSKWNITPQGNLKGGNNVGTVRDSMRLREGRERWKAEYDRRNSLTKDEE